MYLTLVAAASISVAFALSRLCWTVFFSPLARIPGPKSFAWTRWKLAYEDFKGTRTRTIHRLHQKYGPVVRVGPNEVSFNSPAALRQIYGAGSAFGRPESFYKMFDVFGKPHMFTFHSSKDHAARKKIVSQMYSKSAVLKGATADSIQSKTAQFMDLIESDPWTASHLEKSLHYFSLDNISWMVFRDSGAATAALSGRAADRQILSDIEEPTARRYTWFLLHLPQYTRFAMSCGSHLRSILDFMGLMPGKKPLAYSGLSDYALATVNAFRQNDAQELDKNGGVLMRLLSAQAAANGKGSITDVDIASECADHLDAGLKTTSDSLQFALWALSLPRNQHFQQRLAAEVDAVKASRSMAAATESVLPADVCESLPFLDAVVKETLRVYQPIPASQLRSSMSDTTIEGFLIPAGTLVSCQAYSLHRNPEIYPEPYKFNPERWLGDEITVAEMQRWWWPFSSGGRMCLGMQ